MKLSLAWKRDIRCDTDTDPDVEELRDAIVGIVFD